MKLNKKIISAVTFLSSAYWFTGTKLAMAAASADDIFGDSIDKMDEVKDILITKVSVSFAAVVWIVFFICMIMGKTSKEAFGRITLGCVGIGAVGSIVDFLI